MNLGCLGLEVDTRLEIDRSLRKLLKMDSWNQHNKSFAEDRLFGQVSVISRESFLK